MLPRRLLALALAALTLAPAPAHACWDGLRVETEGIELQLMGQLAGAWDPARMQSFATWMARINAIAPDDLWILATDKDVTLTCETCAPHDNKRWDGELATLFDHVAKSVGADLKAKRQALALDTTAYTVQIAAFADRTDADRAAARINNHADVTAVHGFLEIGGFPAMNDAAHVVTVDHDGAPVHRVLVGAFLSRTAAAEAQASLHTDTGLRGFVRPLV